MFERSVAIRKGHREEWVFLLGMTGRRRALRAGNNNKQRILEKPDFPTHEGEKGDGAALNHD